MLIEIAIGVGGFVVGGLAVYAVVSCNHDWNDEEWADTWDMKKKHADEISGQGPRHVIRRGKKQVCEHCGKRRTAMESVNVVPQSKSDEFHDQLIEILLGYPPTARETDDE